MCACVCQREYKKVSERERERGRERERVGERVGAVRQRGRGGGTDYIPDGL